MKRIVGLIIVMLMFVPGTVGQGYICRNMRWSTMLGCYIPGDYRWSTMLGCYVHRDYRWSLLAPSYPYPYPYYFPPYDCPPPIIIQHQSSSVVPNYQVPNNPEQRKEKREAGIRADRQRTKELKELRENDGKEIISAYLRSKNIAFRTNNGFFAKNKTVGLDFFLEGRNIIIKYQNPDEIQMLGQKWQGWEDFCAKSRSGDWKIHEIKSSDKEEILAKLILALN